MNNEGLVLLADSGPRLPGTSRAAEVPAGVGRRCQHEYDEEGRGARKYADLLKVCVGKWPRITYSCVVLCIDECRRRYKKILGFAEGLCWKTVFGIFVCCVMYR